MYSELGVLWYMMLIILKMAMYNCSTKFFKSTKSINFKKQSRFSDDQTLTKVFISQDILLKQLS